MRLLLIISLLFAVSCSNTSTTTDANTSFNYVLAPEVGKNHALKKVVIATVNYSNNSPSYLRNREYKVDKLVLEYLENNGFEVLKGNQFETLWAQGMETYGEYDDPYASSFRRDRFDAILADSLKALKKEYGIDAVIFTDLIPKTVSFGYNAPHFAAWDGVKRRPRVRGDKGVPRGFSWAWTSHAVSLSVTIYSADNRLLFNSVGGIDVIDNIDMRSGSPVVKRDDSILGDEDMIVEGIALAFHPFIKMSGYPGSQ